MYGYIYKTTNLITNKIYIGQKHSSKFLGKSYLGSGKVIRRAIAFYGKENFEVELLEEVEKKELMDEREIYWISHYRATDREIGYNISNGGNVNRTMLGEHNPFYGKHHTEESKRKNSERCKGRVAWNKGLTKEDERVKRYSESVKRTIKEKGSHSRNTVWMHKENVDRMIPQSDVSHYLENGWILGRTELSKESCKRHADAISGRIRINNGYVEKNVRKDELDSYISQGYVKGRLKFKTRKVE